MESSASYRVKVRKEYIPFYKDLIRRKIFQQHADFFTLCCCVSQMVSPREREYSTEALFQAYTFTEYQRTIFKALVFKQTGSILKEKELYPYIENMADQGCQYLLETVISDLIFVDDSGAVSLKPGQEMDLQKQISSFVSQQFNRVPF